MSLLVVDLRTAGFGEYRRYIGRGSTTMHAGEVKGDGKEEDEDEMQFGVQHLG